MGRFKSWLYSDGSSPKEKVVLKKDVDIIDTLSNSIRILSSHTVPGLRPNLRRDLTKTLEQLAVIRDKHIRNMGLQNYAYYLSLKQEVVDKDTIKVA